MKKIAIILALLLLLVSSASATVTVTGVSPLTATEDTAYAGTVTATSGDAGGITGYTLTGPAWLSVSNAGALTGTPLQANAGSNAFTVHVTDADGTADFPFTIAVAAANDAPVLSITDCTDEPDAVEDGEYTCTVTATDEDDTTLTFSLVSPPAGMAISATGAITWTPDDEQIGSHTITVKVEDDETPTKASDTETFTVFVRPQDVCEDYTGGTDLDIDEIDITDDDEDFYPGSKIEMEVSVENNDDEDLEEVVVEAILYDLDDGKILKSVKSEEFEIDEDESESVELTIKVPASLKIGNDIVLFITAYEDGNDDENCDWESNDDLDFARRAHDISISDMVLTPETVKAGQTVELEISVENVGDRDEKDIYITVKNSELLINKKSEEFTIDSYERGDDDEHTTTLTLTIPASAKAGEYELSVYVYDENGKRFTSGFETVTLTVESSGTTTTTTTTTQTTSTATITIKGVSENVEPWKAISIPVQVTNTGSTSAEYKIILTNIGDWAESTSEIDAYLLPGQTSTYYLTITPKEDAVEGKHSATINVKEGSAIVSTKTLSFTVPTEETPAITGGAVVDTGSKGVFQNIFSGTTLWIIGDLVLVVVAIFLIRMLFSKKEGTE